MDYRTETDSLGEVKVPADALWGVQAQRAVENFPISGLRAHPKLIWATAAVKKAAAMTNRDMGKLDPVLAGYIIQAADEVMTGLLDAHFVVDVYQAGAGTSHNMNANEVIANRVALLMGRPLGEYSACHPNDHVNMSQSTNDVFPTAMRVAGIASFFELIDEVQTLAMSFRNKASEFDGVLKSARTHLQDAVPIRLGQEFSGYTVAAEKGVAKLISAATEMGELGIGGTAAGTGINSGKGYASATVSHLRDITGFDLRPSPNLFYAMQSQTAILSASAALRGIATDLIRIANDIRLLSSGPLTGLAEITPPAVQPGSSIMPGKVNPVMAEMLDMVCFQVVGNDLTVAMAAQAGQLELNVMMPVMAHNLLTSSTILKNALSAFRTKCVDGLTADRARCRSYVDSSPAIATALNPHIGYMKAAEVAKEAVKTGRSVAEIALEKGYMTEDELKKALDPMKLTEP
ncbi:MAG: aspartate ammonia-lyase [Nitrospirae bacterium]|nr:aspartate ammonia-lyase [Nitrospirota bacterium]MBI5694521.1 aspartate ammonia-lyase [Nitrospirota bacterium]